MSRSTQYIGLNSFATELVKGMKKIPFPGCVGMFDEPIALNIFTCVNEYGNTETYAEVFDTDVWDSGPMIFTKLVDTCRGIIVKESVWTKEELQSACGFEIV